MWDHSITSLNIIVYIGTRPMFLQVLPPQSHCFCSSLKLSPSLPSLSGVNHFLLPLKLTSINFLNLEKLSSFPFFVARRTFSASWSISHLRCSYYTIDQSSVIKGWNASNANKMRLASIKGNDVVRGLKHLHQQISLDQFTNWFIIKLYCACKYSINDLDYQN